MFGNLTGWHALILIAVVLLLFGAARLPALAKSVGQSVKILKKETASDTTPPASAPEAAPTGDTASNIASAPLPAVADPLPR